MCDLNEHWRRRVPKRACGVGLGHGCKVQATMTTRAQTPPSDRAWLYLVLVFIGLNAVDLGMTYRLIDLGAVELNPVMAAALGAGWMWAIGLKGSITIGVAAGLWLGRRHRIVRRAGVGFIGVFAVLVLYQLVNTWVI